MNMNRRSRRGASLAFVPASPSVLRRQGAGLSVRGSCRYGKRCLTLQRRVVTAKASSGDDLGFSEGESKMEKRAKPPQRKVYEGPESVVGIALAGMSVIGDVLKSIVMVFAGPTSTSAKLSQKIRYLEHEASNLRTEKKGLEDDVRLLRRGTIDAEIRTAKNAGEDALPAAETRARNSEQRLFEMETRLQLVELAKTQAEDRARSLENSLKENDRMIGELMEKKNTAMEELGRLQKDVRSKEKRIEMEKTSRLAELDDLCSKLADSSVSLEEKVGLMETEIAKSSGKHNAKAELRSHVEKILQDGKKMAELEAEAVSLRKENHVFKVEKSQLSQELEEALRIKSAAENATTNMKKDLQKLESFSEKVQKDLAAASRKNKDLEETTKELVEEKEALRNDVENLQKELADVQESAKSSAVDSEKLEKLKTELAEKEEELKSAQKAVEDMVAEKKKLAGSFAEERDRILEDNATRLKSIQKMMSQKESESASRLQRINTLERQVNDSLEANDRALDRANSEMSAMEDALKLAEEEVTKLSADLERKDGYAEEAMFAAECRADIAEEELAKLKEEHDASLNTWIGKYRQLEMKFESEEEDKAEAVEKAVQLQKNLSAVQSELDAARSEKDDGSEIDQEPSEDSNSYDQLKSQMDELEQEKKSIEKKAAEEKERADKAENELAEYKQPRYFESIEAALRETDTSVREKELLRDLEKLRKERDKLRGFLSVIQQDLREHGLDQAAELSQSVLDEVTENVDAESLFLSAEIRKAQALVDKLDGEPKDVLDEVKEEVLLRTEEIQAGLRKAEATLRAETKKRKVKEDSLKDVLDTADLESRAQNMESSLFDYELENQKISSDKPPAKGKTSRRKKPSKASGSKEAGQGDFDTENKDEEKPKRKRGRPRKNP